MAEEKTMSSRLLTMKFMQRAVASSPDSPASVSTASSPRTGSPGGKNAPTGKKSGGGGGLIDGKAIQNALKEVESKRQSALEQHTSANDTHWVLEDEATEDSATETSIAKSATTAEPDAPRKKSRFQIAYVGYSAIDSTLQDDPTSVGYSTGRHQSDKFRRAQERQNEESDDYHSDDSSDNEQPSNGENDEGQDQDMDFDIEQAIQAEFDKFEETHPGVAKKSKKKSKDKSSSSTAPTDPSSTPTAARKKRSHPPTPTAESLRAKEFREKRQRRELNLNKLSSISGVSPNSKGGGLANMVCHSCSQKGHKMADCPQPRHGRGRAT